MSELPHNEFKELLSLTQQWIEQEYDPATWLFVEPQGYPLFQPIDHSPRSSPMPKPVSFNLPPSSHKHPISHQKPPIETSEKSEKAPTETSLEPLSKKKAEPDSLSKSVPTPKTGFQLEPFSHSSSSNIKKYFELMGTHFPHSIIHQTPLTPKAAPANHPHEKQRGIPPIVILSFYQDETSKNFLNNLSQAINNKLLPAAIFSANKIEEENKWEILLGASSLRLLIVPTHKINDLPRLRSYYHAEKKLLATLPFVQLADPKEYLDTPSLKLSLWQAINLALKPA